MTGLQQFPAAALWVRDDGPATDANGVPVVACIVAPMDQLRRKQDIGEAVQLQLIVGAVADPHRPAVLEPRKLDMRLVGRSIDIQRQERRQQ